MKKDNLISCKPCAWDVTEKYIKLSDNSKLRELRKIPIRSNLGLQPNIKYISINDAPPIQYALGKNGEYWRNGIPLTSVLQTLANAGRAKVRII